MVHTQEEIIKALQVIKDECEGILCVDCPFVVNGICKIVDDIPKT